MNYLNDKGEIETLTMKEIKKRTGKSVSWELMNTINKHKVETSGDKKDYEYLKHYLGKVTVFDFNNFKEFRLLQLYPFYQELAIKNGAIDKRIIKEAYEVV
jgi:hypothetical protein